MFVRAGIFYIGGNMPIRSKNLDLLKEIHQFTVDAVVSYEHAIRHVVGQNLLANLKEIKRVHECNLRDIETYIRRNNREVPDRSMDFKGWLLEGTTTIRSFMGDGQILKSLHGLEKTLVKKYREATSEVSSKDLTLLNLVQNGYQEQLENLDFFVHFLESDFDTQDTKHPGSSRKVG